MAKKKKLVSTLKLLKPGDYKTMPWKSGRGETREIAIDSDTPFRWRLSRAMIAESGPFSAFPGYDRSLALLGGASVELNIAGIVKNIAPGEVVSFEGEAKVLAQVKQGGEDLNLFCLREKGNASLHIARYQGKDEVRFPLQGHEHFVHVIEGQVEFLDPNTEEQGVVTEGETLWISRLEEVNLLNLRTAGTGVPATCAWAIVTLN